MIGSDLNDRTIQTFDTCKLHLKRMEFAKSKVDAFIPLNRLEKIGILDSSFSWVQLRKIRNDIAHEYPSSLMERIEGINILIDRLDLLKQIIERCQSILNKHN